MASELAAIMAADVERFTTAMEADEENTLSALFRLRDEILCPNIASFGGRCARSAGDGVLALFPSAVAAVEAALSIQRANSLSPGRPHLGLRIGINLGEVTEEDGTVHGHDVNLAFRVEALASSGGIAVTAPVASVVRDRLPVSFRSAGKRHLRNIREPVRIFHVCQIEEASRGWQKMALAISLGLVLSLAPPNIPVASMAAYLTGAQKDRAIALDFVATGDIAMAEGRTEEARSRYAAALRRDPQQIRALLGIASSYLLDMQSGGNGSVLALARNAVSDALALDPGSAEAHRIAGIVSLHAGEPRSALWELQLAAQIDPHDPEIHLWLGHMLVQNNRSGEGLVHIGEAFARTRFPPAHYYWHEAWARFVGRNALGAKQILQTRRRHLPQNELLLALSHARLGEVEEMLAAMERFRKASPEFGLVDAQILYRFADPHEQELFMGTLRMTGLAE